MGQHKREHKRLRASERDSLYQVRASADQLRGCLRDKLNMSEPGKLLFTLKAGA